MIMVKKHKRKLTTVEIDVNNKKLRMLKICLGYKIVRLRPLFKKATILHCSSLLFD